MFSVFDYDGRLFRNTLEELYRVDPVILTTQPGSNRQVKADDNGSADENTVYAPGSAAIQAYKDLVNISQKQEIHHAYEIMDTGFEFINEKASAFDAIQAMKSGQYDILPILNAERRIVGLFTYDLIFRKLEDIDSGIKSMLLNPVRSFIEAQVITAEPVTSIRRIAEVMHRYNLRIMPITDAGEVVIGIVSYREVLNAVANDPPMSVWT